MTAALDVTEATFQTEVLERSKTVPVIVDFWADWCRPCHALAPLLQREADRAGDEVRLVKVDTEANPGLSQTFQITNIPAVKAWVDGEVADEFVGVLKPAEVNRFFTRLVPSKADRLMAGTQPDEAALRQALESEPGRADASIALARLLVARGDRDEALAVLGKVRGSFQADGMTARLRLEQEEAGAGLAPAFADLDAGNTEAGLDALLAAIPNANGAKDQLRAVVVGVLDELGQQSELARATRRKLAAALF